MALILTREQRMLADSVREFLVEASPVSALRALRDARDPDGYSRGLWQRFAEMGYTGVLVPEAHGGLGLGHVEAGVVMEGIGRQLVATPFLASAVLGATALARAGSAAQQAAWLPRIASAQAIVTFAIDERPKHDPDAIETTARRTADGWRLDGEKRFVPDAHVADAWIVVARVAGDAERAGVRAAGGARPSGLARDAAPRTRALFLVPRDAPGARVERTTMVDAHNAGRLALADVSLPADARLGGAGDDAAGEAALQVTLDAARAALAAELLGVASEAFDRTVRYLNERRQFGKLIGEFQALQHRAAHLHTELEITRAAVLRALQSLDEDASRASPAVSVAKARACDSASLAVQEAVQMHGGIGMTDALDIGLYMKRARVAAELLGDAGFHADRYARSRGY